MTKLSRRTFLFASAATAATLMLPSAAIAAPSRTIVLDGVKDASGKYTSVRVPTGIAQEIGLARAAELDLISNRALSAAQAQNLSVPKTNGLLTRMWKPALKAAPKGIAQAVLEVGLVVGLTLALTNAVAELSKDASTLTMTARACANLPTAPSNTWDYTTGVYRNSGGSAGVAIQRTYGTSGGGTVAAPAGWSNQAQRNARAIGNGQFEWEVQFSKAVACGERIAFPPTVPNGAVPGADHFGATDDANSEANRVKIADTFQQQAKADQDASAALPGGEVPGQVEDGGKVPATSDTSSVKGPTTNVPGTDYTTPRTAIGADDVHVKMPADYTVPDSTPTPTPSTTPTPTPTSGTGKTQIDWGEAPTGTMPTAPSVFSWVPTPWDTPSLPGSCSGLPYNFATLRASGTINPCPLIDTARPILRPISIAGWTAYAVQQFLDL